MGAWSDKSQRGDGLSPRSFAFTRTEEAVYGLGEWTASPDRLPRRTRARMVSSFFLKADCRDLGSLAYSNREGDIWVGLYQYLAQFPGDETPFHVWTEHNGLPLRRILSVGQDRNGNIWLGTDDLGAYKLAAGGAL